MLFAFSSKNVCFGQAVFAVMSVTPQIKLSEEVLATAVIRHYEQMGLPVGVSIQALNAFAARVACGLKKVVAKFRCVYRETPSAAKSKGIYSLKQRLQNEKQTAPAEETHVKEEDLQLLAAPPDRAKILAEKVKKMKEQKAAALASSAVEPVKADGPQERPVPTPARSNVLPKFVLETLQKEKAAEPVAPFSVWEKGAKEDVHAGDSREDGGQKKKKTNQKKNGKKSQKKAKKAVVADDEVENGLGGEVTMVAGSPKDVVREDVCGKYEPKIFLQKKREFIQAQRTAKCIGYREAEQLWMQSDERASYLQTLPLKELKRRRFM